MAAMKHRGGELIQAADYRLLSAFAPPPLRLTGFRYLLIFPADSSIRTHLSNRQLCFRRMSLFRSSEGLHGKQNDWGYQTFAANWRRRHTRDRRDVSAQ